MVHVVMSALISSCGKYRYRLSRVWQTGPKLGFIMLNPSTADAVADDPTIRRCIGFAKSLGYSGIVVGNLFAWRATVPTELKLCLDPVGPENDVALSEMCYDTTMIICAWGDRSPIVERNQRVVQLIKQNGKKPYCLKLTRKSNPGHPLYVPGDTKPFLLETI